MVTIKNWYYDPLTGKRNLLFKAKGQKIAIRLPLCREEINKKGPERVSWAFFDVVHCYLFHFAGGNHNTFLAIPPQYRQLNPAPDGIVGEEPMQVVDGSDWLTVKANNDVALT